MAKKGKKRSGKAAASTDSKRLKTFHDEDGMRQFVQEAADELGYDFDNVADNLAEEDIVSTNQVNQLADDDWKEYGVTKRGHRMNLMNYLDRRRWEGETKDAWEDDEER